MSLTQWPSEVPRIAARDPAGHKGTFGRVLVVGGCVQPPTVMVGGPALAALGALRAGCGLVELAMPTPILVAGLTIAPSAVGHSIEVDPSGMAVATAVTALAERALRADVVVCGPGLGAASTRIVESVLGTGKLVLDADALNAVAADERLRERLSARAPGTTILTPHVGEAARLATALGLGAAASATELSRALGALVVLKSHETSIASRDQAWSVRAGTSALATAGSGDVLAGILGSLWAQQHAADPFAVACQAVCLHGLASVRWSASHGAAGMLAQDLAAAIPAELEHWRLGGTPTIR